MDFSNLESVLANEPKYRFRQAYQYLFKNLISNWDEAKTLPKTLRVKLQAECPIDIDVKMYSAEDGQTKKALVTLPDGNRIETVLMRYKDRNTVCVSCQVGCSMKCDFCATGKMGLTKNLSVAEILMQVLVFARVLKTENQRVSNIVFMGMGEPMLNYDNVMGAVRHLNNEDGLNIGARRISISTCGIVPSIDRLADEPLQVNLALSLHAPTDELRSKLMPVNESYSIDQTLGAVQDYIKKTQRRVMIQYILIKDVNDSRKHAKQVARLLKKYLGKLCMVNLIPFNETIGEYSAPVPGQSGAFKKWLEEEGIEATQRYRLGHDIEGACGQLAAKG